MNIKRKWVLAFAAEGIIGERFVKDLLGSGGSVEAVDVQPCSEDTALPEGVTQMSTWTMSHAKRVFDLVLVSVFAPLLFPLLLVIAAAVRMSSPGAVIFRQTRIGSHGRPFTILKFRTMVESRTEEDCGIASASADRITAVGLFLRKFKLDELPQIINVFRGEMSLVGPRPRIAGQQLGIFPCRPGITGAATLVFVREEVLLNTLPPESLAQFYRDFIVPSKHRLDSEYMARASMLSDLQILFRTAVITQTSPLEQQAPHNSGGRDSDLTVFHIPRVASEGVPERS